MLPVMSAALGFGFSHSSNYLYVLLPNVAKVLGIICLFSFITTRLVKRFKL